jgi:hypothetical protein
VWATLEAGEHGEVDAAFEVELFVEAVEDHGRTRTTEGLVGGGGDDVAVFKRVVEELGSDEAAGVGHVAEEEGPDAVGDGAKSFVVPVTGVGGSSANEDLGQEDLGLGFEGVVVDEAGLVADAVRHGFEEDGGGRDLFLRGVETVGQVASGWKVESDKEEERQSVSSQAI